MNSTAVSNDLASAVAGAAEWGVTEELYVVPTPAYYPNVVLYAPLAGNVVVVAPTVARALQCGKTDPMALAAVPAQMTLHLRAAGILRPTSIPENAPCSFDVPQCGHGGTPTAVTLFLTSRCNLRCSYCYASSGDKHLDMPFELAQKAVDFVIGNAVRTKVAGVTVAFHGGGEQFVAMKLMRRVVAYAKEQSAAKALTVDFHAGTNGVLNPTQREWVVQNFASVCVSLDGPAAIHNTMRPLVGGGDGHAQVVETIRYFEEQKFSYTLRSTVTELNVDRMVEMIDFIRAISSRKRLHFEPVAAIARARDNGIAVAPERFAAKFIEARAYARSVGIKLAYSSGRSDEISHRFCGACGGNFYVTPDGAVSACLEVVDGDAPSDFIYGRATTTGFEFFPDKLRRLAERSVERLPDCRGCFAKHHCGGDCPAKVLASSGDMYVTGGNVRCVINRSLLADELVSKLQAMPPSATAGVPAI